jgi:hypothetical protein
VDGVEVAELALLDHHVAVADQRGAAAGREEEGGELASEGRTTGESHGSPATPDGRARVTGDRRAHGRASLE